MIKRRLKQYRGYECLNCETPLDISEKFCHHCGQLNSTKKITIKDFIEEFLSNFYAYDSRLRNSIISMFTKPGILAREFNEGKRQKYANPFRLFLSVSIILFFSFTFTENKNNVNTNINKNEEAFVTKTQTELEKELNKISDTISKKDSLALKEKINTFKTLSVDSIYTKSQLEKNQLDIYYRISSFRNFHLKYPEKLDEKAIAELGFENNRLNRFIYAKAKLFKSNKIKDELKLYFYQKLPFLIFLSLPIITIIFWLVFYSKKINYTEHLVFTYTFFTFLFICLILFNIIDYFSDTVSEFLIGICSTIIFPFYLYRSLRNFYQQNRWKTIFKFVILNPLFGIFLLISILIMLFLGILLF
ncbi:conserved membrane hypothetical protein [Flavobacterium sp. 9AF]|uniref:DUF3667 domain-containing protein n=1 Tax=Flavobacterium sp. 9AF TaxID=2653142 RepID=UPI0012EF0269|nr:DUF3667 domain-containing protein [Flavobacterium sp. 9AF]VXB12327.1 conserved membrane hypothetical protein [Flavobacterium sp. 9AF]